MKNYFKVSIFLMVFLANLSLWAEVLIQSNYKVDSAWDGGYTLDVTINNDSTKVMKGWKSTFSLASSQKIDSLWNGQYVVSGSNATVQNQEWNGDLQPGQAVTFGMQISGAGTPGILNLKTIGDDGAGGGIPDTNPNDPLLITLVPSVSVLSTWDGGSQILISLQNLSETDVNRWVMEFDLAAQSVITGLCGGEFAISGSHVVITSPLWVNGGLIAKGSKKELTVTLKTQSPSPITNIVARGNPVANVEVPLAPVLNSISNDDKDGNYTISWKAVSGALRYTLEQSSTISFSNPVEVLTDNVLQKVVQGQTPGTYYYRVLAIGQSANSAYSNVQSVVVSTTPSTLGSPLLANIANVDLDGNYIVTWSAVENASSYILEESADAGFDPFVAVYKGTNTQKGFKLKADGTYYYRVKAKNSKQISVPSLVVPVRVSVNNPVVQERKIIGYFPNWAMYRAKPFYAKDIDPSLVTHINYAFAPVDTAGNIRLFDPWSDTDFNAGNTGDKPYSGNFYQLYLLKKQNPKLKTLISLGGWTLSDPFSQMAANATTRENFAQNCVDFCKKYDFDGVDIDWEYPGFADHSGRPEDTKNFTLLLETVSKKLKAQNPPLLLTIASPAGYQNYNNMEVAKIHPYLDWINLMTYDFHGPWAGGSDDVTNHLAPIKPTAVGDPKFNIESVLNYYLSQGVPKEKLTMGLPMYGRSFAAANGTPTGLYSPYTGPGHATTEETGYVFYSDIQNNLLKTYKSYWDPAVLGAYVYNTTTKDFISYDSKQSWTLKAGMIKDLGLGGAMVWELGMDTAQWEMMSLLNQELRN